MMHGEVITSESESKAPSVGMITGDEEAGDSVVAGHEAPTALQGVDSFWTITPTKSRLVLRTDDPDEPSITVKDLKEAMKELNEHERGFDKLVIVMALMSLYFVAVIFTYDATMINHVNSGLKTAIKSVTYGESSDLIYTDVRDTDDASDWISALAMDLYHGELESQCNVCSAVYSSCEVCYDTYGAIYNVSSCIADCSAYSSCFNGACDSFNSSADSRYPYDWYLNVPSDCDFLTIVDEKGLTSVAKDLWLETQSTLPYSRTSGMTNGGFKLLSFATITWQRRQTKECQNAGIQDIYGICKSYNSVVQESIYVNTSEIDNGFSIPLQVFKFNEDAQVNGAVLDLGTFNLGGWVGYCVGQATKLSYVFKNVERIKIQFFGLNAQSSAINTWATVTFHFTSGGYVDATIDTISFPVLMESYDKKTPTEIAAEIILYLIGFILPFVFLMYNFINFSINFRHISWKVKFYFVLDWLQNTNNFVAVMFNIFIMLTSITNTVYVSKMQHLDFVIGEDIEIASAGEETLASLIGSAQTIESALVYFRIWLAMFFITCILSIIYITKIMSFHKHLALVRDVVVGSALDLLHFALVFLSAIVVFSIILATYYGPHNENFSSIWQSVLSTIRIGLGDAGDFYEEMLEITDSTAYIIAPLTVYSLQFSIGLLFLNILISISVDAYMRSRESFDSTDWAIWESLLCYVCRKYLRVQNWLSGGFKRSERRKWEALFMKMFAKPSLSNSKQKTIALSTAIEMIEYTPCARKYAKMIIQQILEKSQEEAGKGTPLSSEDKQSTDQIISQLRVQRYGWSDSSKRSLMQNTQTTSALAKENAELKRKNFELSSLLMKSRIKESTNEDK